MKTVIDGHDCSLLHDRSKAPTSSNAQSMTQLISGFFRYFATFDFNNKVSQQPMKSVRGKGCHMTDRVRSCIDVVYLSADRRQDEWRGR